MDTSHFGHPMDPPSPSSALYHQSSQLVDLNFMKCLKRDPTRRTVADIQSIYLTLRSLDCLARVDNPVLLMISETCTYMSRSANEILYCRGEMASHWYILLSGSVFIDGSMFLPIASFGRRLSSNQTRRPNECLILEPSEMICIEYELPVANGVIQSNSRISTYSNYSSDTSSAYSGSDTMGSSVVLDNHSDNDMDLTGLKESTVDSEDEFDDLTNSMDSLTVKDAVRECLEKDPSERTDPDINHLLEFTQHLKAFNDLTAAVRRALCQVMVFAVVDKANTIVLNHGEELDSWSVVVNGLVEVYEDEKVYVLQPGESFGLPPTLDKQYFNGEMRTKVDDCQFICVTQDDYYRILRQGRENQTKITKNNMTVLVTELKTDIGSIIIRGTVEELMNQLVASDNPSMDPTYVEDFLLTHRIFSNSNTLATSLLNWFSDSVVRDRVARVVLLWVNNHFVDFEMSEALMGFLMRFQQLLENKTNSMSGQLRLLQIACSAKSRTRKVILNRPSRDDPLPFNIMGGSEVGHGIYISSVEPLYSTTHKANLRVADELLDVNGQSMNGISINKAYDLLRSSTHLVISVKCNFLGYYECSHTTGIPSDSAATNITHVTHLKKAKPTFTGKIKRTLLKFHVLSKSEVEEEIDSSSMGSDNVQLPENVLKVYRPDQNFKYLMVNRETTAQEVVMLALQEFVDLSGHNSRDYALFQVSCPTATHIKQTRLPPTLDSLAERLPLGSRYYVKKQDDSCPCLPDDGIPDLLKESEVSIQNLNPTQLAYQLTLEDYVIFRQIESTEYIDDLFGLKSNYGTPNLTQFSQLVNKETFWVVNEILKESNVNRRVSIIKRFIKMANVCKEIRNFNSMFSIISGLGNSAVSQKRLKGTWEKVPNKYRKVFTEMEQLMDPSRNMGKYRSLLANGQTPMIPFYPIVRKDLTFIDLGNSSSIDNLVNFEKMRMLAREIRTLVQMSTAPFDTTSAPILASMNQLKSSSAQLTTTTGKRRKLPLNPKKMYEEMNMIRKVKAYLSNLEVIEDENVLSVMSLSAEPEPSSKKSAMEHPVRKAPSSPTLSTTSSTDSRKVYPLSGSLAQYQKLMSLSERSRTKKPHGNGNGGGLSASMSIRDIDMRSADSSGIPASALVPLSTESSSVCSAGKQ